MEFRIIFIGFGYCGDFEEGTEDFLGIGMAIELMKY